MTHEPFPISFDELNALTDKYSDNEISKLLSRSKSVIIRARKRYFSPSLFLRCFGTRGEITV